MSNYAVVHAEFPQVNSKDRESIYEYLDGEQWEKVQTSGENTVSTTWYANFEDTVRYTDVITISKNDFINSAKRFKIKPSLIIHVGPNKPFIEIQEK